MPEQKILPALMIVISLGASIVYFYAGDVRRGLYWLFAAGLTASVTF